MPARPPDAHLMLYTLDWGASPIVEVPTRLAPLTCRERTAPDEPITWEQSSEYR